jgi:hypothetical protein
MSKRSPGKNFLIIASRNLPVLHCGPCNLRRVTQTGRIHVSQNGGMTLPLTAGELECGVRYWRGTKWPQDFHHAFYQEMAYANPDGAFDLKWWESFYRVLRSWRANRPRSGAFLAPRAVARFDELRDAWAEAVRPYLAMDLAELEWGQVSAFPLLVAQIKDVSSPVFTSKFCHFLAPHIFPVVDNAAMGNPFRTYESYFEASRTEWLSTPPPVQRQLVAALATEVGALLDAIYPVKAKLVELCIIGRHLANKRIRQTPRLGEVDSGANGARGASQLMR